MQFLSEKKRLDIMAHCFLVGGNFDRANLRKKNFAGVNLTDATFRGADLSYANLRGAKLIQADLSRACLHMADLTGADLSSADLTGAYLKAANFTDARIWFASLRRVTAKNCLFINTDLTGSDFFQAELLGARFNGAILTMVRNMTKANFYWYMSPRGGPPSYDPIPGWWKMDSSILGDITLRENAHRKKR
jgi:uncharacterized protein YjbI with pentapeptide repeats